MSAPSDNETWIIDAGDDVIQKEAAHGKDSLSPKEKLIYCLWVADYGMRNAGDLETARDVYTHFQSEAAHLATTLSLAFTIEPFSLSPEALEQQYFERFERLCNEIKAR